MTNTYTVKRMNPEWQAKVESKLDTHDKDLHSIAGSLKDINQQMTKTNEILQEFALKDERFHAKIQAVETTVVARIAANEGAIERLGTRLDKIDAGIAKFLWIVGTFLLLGVVGAVVKFEVFK